MLLYLKNNSSDVNLTSIMNKDAYPFTWMWERTVENGGKYVLLAWSVLISWCTYLIVSVVELVAWVFYIFGEYSFARFWFSTIGYWGSIVAYFVGPLFAVIYFGATLGGNTNAFPGAWTLWLFIGGFALWIVHGLLHIFFVPAFLAYIDAQPVKACECDILPVKPVSDDASDIEKLAFKEDTIARANLCIIQCPVAIKDKCPIYRSRGSLSAEEYDVACAEIERVKGTVAEGAEATEASLEDASTDTDAVDEDSENAEEAGW